MIKGDMDRAISVTDADNNRVVCIVGLDFVVVETNDLPLAVRKLPSTNADLAIRVIVCRVLVAAMRCQRRLLV